MTTKNSLHFPKVLKLKYLLDHETLILFNDTLNVKFIDMLPNNYDFIKIYGNDDEFKIIDVINVMIRKTDEYNIFFHYNGKKLELVNNKIIQNVYYLGGYNGIYFSCIIRADNDRNDLDIKFDSHIDGIFPCIVSFSGDDYYDKNKSLNYLHDIFKVTKIYKNTYYLEQKGLYTKAAKK
ncbi:hypothetical protein Hokovirus_1_47 [Hokovirus HKV1]|uniref:Uncharacterized protein n=1 Tax=Hokovirus HKV1 TaxID=1977638 RepID=A0A1V0SEV4_9VIRU|nr:hypothetical protein Hokovirus_1_47 [Hokovirus HKV1]